VLTEAFVLPKQQRIDGRMILGATIFGVGWGLVGLCPGPTVISVLYNPSVGVFAIALLAGVAGHERISWSDLFRRGVRLLVPEIPPGRPTTARGDSR
jgi:uncharacterized membrane protein YedE/YeeE